MSILKLTNTRDLSGKKDKQAIGTGLEDEQLS